MLAEMHESRLQMAKFIKSSPVMGADYIDEYPFGGEEHPYKNLANIILWCEAWINKIKQNDYLEKIKPSFNKEDKLKIYHELLAMVQDLYQDANDLKDKIVNDELADDGAGLINYMKEDELLKSLDPNMSFMHNRLLLLEEILHSQESLIRRNLVITNGLKHCFITYLTIQSPNIKSFEESIYNLQTKYELEYGHDVMHDYVKSIWVYRRELDNQFFDIKSLVRDVSIILQESEYKSKLMDIFFTEFESHYNAYLESKSLITIILSETPNNFDITFFNYVKKLYSDNLTTSRPITFYNIWEMENARMSYDTELMNDMYEKTIFWKTAVRSENLSNREIKKIELNAYDKFLFFHYHLICVLVAEIKQISSNEQAPYQRYLRTISDYIINKSLYNSYKILLLFIGTNPINTDKDTNLYKIKQMALESLQHRIN